MLAEERRRKIVYLLREAGAVRTTQLAQAFNVSDQTIRRDLGELESGGILQRTHGGGVLANYRGVAYEDRASQSTLAKDMIARAAADLVRPGMTIALSPGTTTAAIAREIDGQSITVVTNSLSVAQCIRSRETSVLVTGGRLRTQAKALVGPIAQRSLDDAFSDISFIGVSGIALGEGYSVTDADEASMLRGFIRIAKRAIVVTDTSKFSRSADEIIAPIGMVHDIITDDALEQEHQHALHELGVSVIIALPEEAR